MKICLLAIGKTLDMHAESINDYAKRINRYIPFSIRCLPEAKNTKNMTQELQKSAEGVMFANEFEKSDYVVLLDEKGKELSSKEFSAFMAKKCRQSRNALCLLSEGLMVFPPTYMREPMKCCRFHA